MEKVNYLLLKLVQLMIKIVPLKLLMLKLKKNHGIITYTLPWLQQKILTGLNGF